MSYQQITTPFFEKSSAERSFLSAVTLAKEYKAHIDVVHMRPRINVMTGAHVNYQLAWAPEEHQILEERNEQKAAELEAFLGKLCAQYSLTLCDRSAHTEAKGVTVSWRESTGYLPDDLIANARLADLIVLSNPDDDTSSYEKSFAQEFIFQSGRPVIIADVVEKIPQTVVVGWDGSLVTLLSPHKMLPIICGSMVFTRWHHMLRVKKEKAMKRFF